MSIQLVNLRVVAKNENLNEALDLSLALFSEAPAQFYLEGFAGATLFALRDLVNTKAVDFGEQVNELLTVRVQETNSVGHAHEINSEDVIFGRLGLRPITAPFVQEIFPEASHELVLTLLDATDETVNVFLVYV